MTTQCVGLKLAGGAFYAAYNRTTLTRLVLLDPLNSKSRPRPELGFSLGGDRRVGACASGDELVSLGFRVGNPSAIGGASAANFPASLLSVGVTPTPSRDRDAQFASRSRAERDPAYDRKAETIPRAGVVFYRVLPHIGKLAAALPGQANVWYARAHDHERR
jgi:hypothetical protein